MRLSCGALNSSTPLGGSFPRRPLRYTASSVNQTRRISPPTSAHKGHYGVPPGVGRSTPPVPSRTCPQKRRNVGLGTCTSTTSGTARPSTAATILDCKADNSNWSASSVRRPIRRLRCHAGPPRRPQRPVQPKHPRRSSSPTWCAPETATPAPPRPKNPAGHPATRPRSPPGHRPEVLGAGLVRVSVVPLRRPAVPRTPRPAATRYERGACGRATCPCCGCRDRVSSASAQTLTPLSWTNSPRGC